MPLPEDDQRQLQEIERALYADDPEFARRIRVGDPRVRYKRTLVQGGTSAACTRRHQIRVPGARPDAASEGPVTWLQESAPAAQQARHGADWPGWSGPSPLTARFSRIDAESRPRVMPVSAMPLNATAAWHEAVGHPGRGAWVMRQGGHHDIGNIQVG
jgi:Protein of unknown function (DUF3040)